MEQYERSGPTVEPTQGPKQRESKTVEELVQLTDRQDQRIRDLEREVRKLRTDLRTAINTFNSAKSNG